jgi:hypothetical protein
VRRDEAEAQSRAEAEEKRQQELDAERRLAILRGEAPPPSPPPIESEAHTDRRKRNREDEPLAGSSFRERKKRKRFGEDDTDFEMRVARERTAAGTDAVSRLTSSITKTSDAPIVDSRGHIALFPELETEESKTSRKSKNEEAEREAAKKRRDYEDQYTMRFANAAGRDGVGVITGSAGPWYTGSSSRDTAAGIQTQQTSGKDVWGNDDPNRKIRDAARTVADDPLAMMKRGAAKARDVEKGRRAVNEEKTRELRQLRKEEKRREKRRRHHDDDADDLEGFTLDGQYMSNDRDRDRERGHGRSHREHRPRSHQRDEQREHRHRHSSHHDRRDRGHRDDGRRESSRHRSRP